MSTKHNVFIFLLHIVFESIYNVNLKLLFLDLPSPSHVSTLFLHIACEGCFERSDSIALNTILKFKLI